MSLYSISSGRTLKTASNNIQKLCWKAGVSIKFYRNCEKGQCVSMGLRLAVCLNGFAVCGNGFAAGVNWFAVWLNGFAFCVNMFAVNHLFRSQPANSALRKFELIFYSLFNHIEKFSGPNFSRSESHASCAFVSFS